MILVELLKLKIKVMHSKTIIDDTAQAIIKFLVKSEELIKGGIKKEEEKKASSKKNKGRNKTAPPLPDKREDIY